MAEKKQAEGVKFLLKLDQAALSKDGLLDLAQEVISQSHDKRTFVERDGYDLYVNPTSVKLGSLIGLRKAIKNENLGTNDRLNMIMQKYISISTANGRMSAESAIKHFRKEFAAKHPQEFGQKAHSAQPLNYVLKPRGNSIV